MNELRRLLRVGASPTRFSPWLMGAVTALGLLVGLFPEHANFYALLAACIVLVKHIVPLLLGFSIAIVLPGLEGLAARLAPQVAPSTAALDQPGAKLCLCLLALPVAAVLYRRLLVIDDSLPMFNFVFYDSTGVRKRFLRLFAWGVLPLFALAAALAACDPAPYAGLIESEVGPARHVLVATALGVSGFAIVWSVYRTILLLAMAWRQKQQYKRLAADEAHRPRVSVIVPAYNEEKVIVKTVKTLLESNYEDLEVVVVNDGSTDKTSDVVRQHFGDNPLVKLIEKPNSGKTYTVNVGVRNASGEIVVILDADTIVTRDAIRLLARHFKDEKVGAVAGNIKISNVRNFVTLCQHIEYVIAINLERRAFDALHAHMVVPGCCGAWRKSAVLEVGSFPEDNLSEDCAVTLLLQRAGYRVMYDERAIAYTEAPESARGLFKQRVRWVYGIIQCLWKHRDLLFMKEHRMLGFVTIPNSWISTYCFQTFAPAADILVVLALAGVVSLKTGLAVYAGYFLVDLAIAAFSFTLDQERLRALLPFALVRTFQRFFAASVLFKCYVDVAIGVPLKWNKLKRTGFANIEALAEREPACAATE